MTRDKTLIILMTLIASAFILAIIGLVLIQSPDAPLPWEDPTATNTNTPFPPTATAIHTATSTGTRRPTRTPLVDTPPPPTVEPISPSPNPSASMTFTPAPTASGTPFTPTPSQTGSPALPSATNSPSPAPGVVVVTGRVVDQGDPLGNVTITLEGLDVLTTTTNAQGVYRFEVDWIDEDYSLVFSLDSNTQLSPQTDYVLWSWVDSILEGNTTLPDLEISNAPDGVVFTQTSPPNGSSISASYITADNPLRMEWTAYPEAEEYWVDLGLDGDDYAAWASDILEERFVDFDGTLDDGTRISPGTYWWAVGTLRMEADYDIYTYTQTWTLQITQ